ncbi:MAG: hypothetical protein HRT88_10590 [Lentisphaeraceae bacterium]|nr:hypothetical protein [Lentisphaeraceae bacterium]
MRQAQRVDAAKIEALLGKNTSRYLASLKKYLAKNSLEGKSYEKYRKLIYDKYLKRILTDILKSKASAEHKSQAACILLGFTYNVSNVKVSSDKRQFHLKASALKHGELSITLDGYKAKKEMLVSSENDFKTRCTVDADQKVVMMNIEWNGIKFKRSLNLSDAEGSEDKEDRWAPKESDIIYGPFTGTLKLATPDGCLQVYLGETVFQCALASNCLVIDNGQEYELKPYLQQNKEIPAGTKIRFSYYNSKGKEFRATCTSLEVL